MPETAVEIIDRYRRLDAMFRRPPTIVPRERIDALRIRAEQAAEKKAAEEAADRARVTTYAPAVIVTGARDVIDVRSADAIIAAVCNSSITRARRIVAEVAEAHAVSLADMMSRRMNPQYALARQVAMWRISKETALSLPSIGKVLGGKDHSTVLHAIRKIDRLIAEGRAVVG